MAPRWNEGAKLLILLGDMKSLKAAPRESAGGGVVNGLRMKRRRSSLCTLRRGHVPKSTPLCSAGQKVKGQNLIFQTLKHVKDGADIKHLHLARGEATL